MKIILRIAAPIISLLAALMALSPLPPAVAETLAEIDQEIQADPSIKTDRGGLDAYNIYQGVTTSRLDRKINILAGSGINPRFYQSADGVRDYSNFYSFTGRAGATDTKLDIVTTESSLRLYRRGSSRYKEATGYLGSWWGDQYRGTLASRDQQAILAAWGSDLQRIYVIDVPTGHSLVGGLAAPMERNGEYRGGGAYQYYYRGAPANWLVYALYAPDYLKSYAGAVTSAQKAGRGIATGLGSHLHGTRLAAGDTHGEAGDQTAGDLWLRGYGGSLDSDERDGSSTESTTMGMSAGWQRRIPADRSAVYLGLIFGHGANLQQYDGSGVENDTRATVGGIYGLYIANPEGPQSWYGNGSVLLGGLSMHNSVPGELGYGLDQEYNGQIAVVTVENGISLRQGNSWFFEPHLQLSYTRIHQSDFHDQLGARISLQQGDSFSGRLGLEVRKSILDSKDLRLHLWTRLSYLRNFSGANEVDVDGDLASSALERNSPALAAGTDLKLSAQWSLQAQIEQIFAGEEGLQGNLALRYTW
ncbi:MAG: autotransporter domain-containing protein [Desulforhopalus sp.]|nr:autotransporter domain-containing protein [Desulforhopalus sp.]